MKKLKIGKIFHMISVVLLFFFFVHTVVDYNNYNSSNSAPFYVTILKNSCYYILPIIFLFIIYLFIKSKKGVKKWEKFLWEKYIDTLRAIYI